MSHQELVPVSGKYVMGIRVGKMKGIMVYTVHAYKSRLMSQKSVKALSINAHAISNLFFF